MMKMLFKGFISFQIIFSVNFLKKYSFKKYLQYFKGLCFSIVTVLTGTISNYLYKIILSSPLRLNIYTYIGSERVTRKQHLSVECISAEMLRSSGHQAMSFSLLGVFDYWFNLLFCCGSVRTF